MATSSRSQYQRQSSQAQIALVDAVQQYTDVLDTLKEVYWRTKQVSIEACGLDKQFSCFQDEEAAVLEASLECEPIVVVVGPSNAGKSSLLNQFLRNADSAVSQVSRLLPIKETPCSARVTCVTYDEDGYIRHLDCEGKEIPDTRTSFQLRRERLSSSSSISGLMKCNIDLEDDDRKDREQVAKICEVGWPHSLLKAKLVFVDTPGIGENTDLTDTVQKYLSKRNCICVLYVIDGKRGFTDPSDKENIRNVSEYYTKKDIIYVINKIERNCSKMDISTDEDDSDNEQDGIGMKKFVSKDERPGVLVDRARKKLVDFGFLNEEEAMCKVLGVSTMTVFKKMSENGDGTPEDDELLANFYELEARLANFLSSKAKELVKQVADRLLTCHEQCIEYALKQSGQLQAQHGIQEALLKSKDIVESLFQQLLTINDQFPGIDIMTNYTNSKLVDYLMDYAAIYNFHRAEERVIMRFNIINFLNTMVRHRQLADKKLGYFLLDLADLASAKLINIYRLSFERFINEEAVAKTFHCQDSLNFLWTLCSSPGDPGFGGILQLYLSHTLSNLDNLEKKKTELSVILMENYLSKLDNTSPVAIETATDRKAVAEHFCAIIPYADIREMLKDIIEMDIVALHSMTCAGVFREIEMDPDAKKIADPSTSNYQDVLTNFLNLFVETRAIKFRVSKSFVLERNLISGMQLLAQGSASATYANSIIKGGTKVDVAVRIPEPENAAISDEKWLRLCKDLYFGEMIHRTALIKQYQGDTFEGLHHLALVKFWVFEQNTSRLFIVCDLAKCSLPQFLMEESRPLKLRVQFGLHMLHVLQMWHACGYVHLDMRPEAILISLDGTKAMVNMARVEDTTRDFRLGNGRRVPAFHIAPSRYEEKISSSRIPEDVYALGSLLWVLAEGSGVQVPTVFHNASDFEQMKKRVLHDGVRPEPVPDAPETSLLYKAMQMCWDTENFSDNILSDVRELLEKFLQPLL